MTQMNNTDNSRSYYCSMKFKYLKIDLRRNTTCNCHAAKSHPIDFTWLKKNPGNLFNTDINVREREMMLRNERNSSCEQNCWVAEDRGAVSPRILQNGVTVTHTDTVTSPEIIDLTVNIDCNLTCSYCCKEYSSSWQRDLINQGDYVIHGVSDSRYTATMQDRVLNKISQHELHNLTRYQLLLNEFQSYRSTLKRIDVTGGEPLLDNYLIDTLSNLDLNPDCEIIMYTGLGLSNSRFERLITQLAQIKNLRVRVSAENIGPCLEFNRYGIDWQEFQHKIKILDQHVNWSFFSTITNLTIFGFKDFTEYFKDADMEINFAYQPRFMSPFVLDQTSKKIILDQIENLNPEFKQKITDSMRGEPTDDERLAIKDFLTTFTSRRPQLSVDIFPKSFLQWMEIN